MAQEKPIGPADEPSPNATYYTERQFRRLNPMCHVRFHAEAKAGRLRKTKFGKSTVIMRADAKAWEAARFAPQVSP